MPIESFGFDLNEKRFELKINQNRTFCESIFKI